MMNNISPQFLDIFGFQGNIWWHKKWIYIYKGYIPRSYVVSIVLAIIFFACSFVVL